jgi:hypothetical protein
MSYQKKIYDLNSTYSKIYTFGNSEEAGYNVMIFDAIIYRKELYIATYHDTRNNVDIFNFVNGKFKLKVAIKLDYPIQEFFDVHFHIHENALYCILNYEHVRLLIGEKDTADSKLILSSWINDRRNITIDSWEGINYLGDDRKKIVNEQYYQIDSVIFQYSKAHRKHCFEFMLNSIFIIIDTFSIEIFFLNKAIFDIFIVLFQEHSILYEELACEWLYDSRIWRTIDEYV